MFFIALWHDLTFAFDIERNTESEE